MRKTVVIIPAFNEERSIGRVIADIPKDLVEEIVVVDNGSTDSTAQIASQNGATVVNEERKGYGNACLAGINYIKSCSYLPHIIVFLDGDYSDYPQEMRTLISPIVKDEYDLVIGSRTLGKREKGALLPQAVVGNYIATRLIKLLYRVSFTDLGPFRAIRYDKLLALKMSDKTFGWTVEMQIKAAKTGLRCVEVPVRYRKRIGASKITGTVSGSFKAAVKIILMIFKQLFKLKFLYERPRQDSNLRPQD